MPDRSLVSRRIQGALFALAISSASAVAAAQDLQGAPLWIERWTAAMDPRRARVDALAARAEASFEEATVRTAELRMSARQASSVFAFEEQRRIRALLDAAVRDAREALAIAPSHGLARYVVARVREQLDAPPAEIIAATNAALSSLAADERERRALLSFSLGVAHTRLEQHALARDAYESIVDDPGAPGRSTALCNLAEVHMYLGEVTRSLERYRECARLMPTSATAFWGLAVAHDRAAHDADSRIAADRAISIDPDMRDIEGEGVFYVPAFERHYYMAIAREAQARRLGEASTLINALASWRAYTREGGPLAPWLDRAQAHMRSIEVELSLRTRPQRPSSNALPSRPSPRALRAGPAQRAASSPR